MRKGWELMKLGEVLKIQNGYAFNSKLFSTELGVPLIRIRDIKNGFKTETNFNGPYEKKYEVHAGDFLIGMDGEFGCYEWKGDKSLLNQRVCRLQEFNDRLNPRFLLYGINKYLKAIEEVTAFATVKHISSKQIEAIEIPLPPLPEQKRIVAILDECFLALEKAKANAEQNLKNAKELFESYLQEVFEKKGEGWEETSLKNETELLVGFAFKSNGYSELENDILLIRGDNIMQGYFRWEDAKRWDKSEYGFYHKYQLKENDIVFAMDRPWVKAGLKIARISKFELPSLLVQRTACLRTKDNIETSFLYYLLNSKRFMKYLIDVQTGIGVPHISGQQILNFEFNLPTLQDQESIVRQLDALRAETQKLEAVYEKKLSDLEELKKSILQKAFAGELKTEEEVIS